MNGGRGGVHSHSHPLTHTVVLTTNVGPKSHDTKPHPAESTWQFGKTPSPELGPKPHMGRRPVGSHLVTLPG